MRNVSLPSVPLIDETSLQNHAKSLLEDHNYCNAALKTLLKQSTDSDLKMALCYSYLSNKHKTFIGRLNHSNDYDVAQQKSWHFIIVPALLHNSFPALGGDGNLFAEIARKKGHTVELLNVDGGRPRAETITILADTVDRCRDNKKLCLVGISRGTTDILAYIDQFGATNIDLVINIAGLIKGTPLSSHIMLTAWRRLKYRLVSLYCNVAFQAIQDLSCESEIYKKTFDIAREIKLINFIGTPLKSHVQPHLLKRYLRLNEYGPNDGMVMLEDYIDFPGWTCPIWGGDHFFRLPGYSHLLYQLFNTLDEITTI